MGGATGILVASLCLLAAATQSRQTGIAGLTTLPRKSPRAGSEAAPQTAENDSNRWRTFVARGFLTAPQRGA